jgi:hypothetical protein
MRQNARSAEEPEAMPDKTDHEACISASGLASPESIWCETQGDNDACDVIVRMEDGTVYTASFVTIPFLQRQMTINCALSAQLPHSPTVRYIALDTPHIVVDQLDRDTIEDTIDHLIALDVFEGLFTRVTTATGHHQSVDDRLAIEAKLTTQEVAAVVISDVLQVVRN